MTHHVEPTPGVRFRSGTSTFVLIAGWSLLAVFVVWAASLRSIGADVASFQIAYLVGIVGYGLLSWFLLARSPARGLGSWRSWFVGCMLLRGALLAMEPSDDVHRYVWEGRIQNYGFNPYRHAPKDPRLADLRDEHWSRINHPDYPAIYPPLAQIEFLLIASVSTSPYGMKIVHVMWDLLTIGVLASCLSRIGRPKQLAVLYGACPLVLTAFAIEGHVDSLMLLLLALTWRAVLQGASNPNSAEKSDAATHSALVPGEIRGDPPPADSTDGSPTLPRRRGHTWVAGLCLGGAIAVKLLPLVLLPWFLFRRWRVGVLAGAVAVLIALPYFGGGQFTIGSLVRFGVSTECLSLLGALDMLGNLVIYDRFIPAIALAVILLIAVWRLRDPLAYAAVAFTVLLALLPVIHYWYFCLLIVLLSLRPRVSVIAASAVLVVYFEAELARQTTGDWAMPPWAGKTLWAVFLGTVVVETLLRKIVGPRRIAGLRRILARNRGEE